MKDKVNILGFQIDNVRMAETIAQIKGFIQLRSPHQVITANSLMLHAAIDNQRLKEVFARSALVVPDSIGLLLAGKILGQPLLERVTGIDLMYHLFALCQKEGFSIYLLGAKPGIAAEAAEQVRQHFPGLKIAGTHHGYFDAREEAQVMAEIRKLKPDMLFVGLNIPRQEMWIAEHLETLGVPVAIGIGGSFDVISGRIKRAPAGMQQAGLEWLWRTILEPWRIKRIILLPVFLWKVYRQKWQDKVQ
ncbi:MAG: WecB/TagA/CpsF family glycosyltransferase [bacterium]|nr:WecB/TagA/CpsF family glycosyltransferase [bacterium]MDD5756681.1 WecB/TagA/CpsF family glycosyltransferase [bacterium]